MTVRGLIHAHSRHSFDSLLPPSAYLGYARRRRLDFVCLTDHGTIAGSQELARLNDDPGLEVVIGAEYATDRGDVIGLFLRDEIHERRFDGVVDAVRQQRGLVLLPHPYRNHRLADADWGLVDLVEIFNARSSAAANRAALDDAVRHGIAQTVGADIHTGWELLRNGTFVSLLDDGRQDLRQLLLHAPRSYTTRSSSRNLTRYSQVVKTAKRFLGRRR